MTGLGVLFGGGEERRGAGRPASVQGRSSHVVIGGRGLGCTPGVGKAKVKVLIELEQ